jgi:Flp pilus assembly protein TadD
MKLLRTTTNTSFGAKSRAGNSGMGDIKLRLGQIVFALALVCAADAVAQATDPLHEAHELLEARELIASGQLSKSEAYLQSYVSEHPSSADAHFLLGFVLFRNHKAKESLAEFTAGAKIRRPSAVELETVASDYVLLGDFVDADKWFTEVSVENPKDFHLWYLLGRTKYNEGRYEEAVASFEHALALRPRDVEAENNRGLALRELNKLEQARDAFQNAIDWQGEAPVDPQPMLNLGTLFTEQGKFEKAVPLLLQAARLSPENPSVHEQLGAAYSAQNDLQKAQGELERAVALAPDTSALHYKLGELFRKQKRRDLAQKEFDICAKLNSTHSSGNTPNPFQPAATGPK